MIRVWLFAAIAILQIGCATVGRQTREVLKSPPADIPRSVQLENVPFIEQSAGHCGPATLTMVMRSTGANVSVDQITPEVYTPGMKGSLQLDLISASRRHGLMAIPLVGLEPLLREVAAGHPAIVFENLALSWYPKWHYAVVIGYDLNAEQLILHSGPNAFERVDMIRFEHAWSLGKYWGLVVLPAGQLSRTADEIATLRAAAGIEQAGLESEAAKAYGAILLKWPESLGALIGMGNLSYKRRAYKEAVGFLKQATKFHPNSTQAKHNLSVAESALSGRN